MPGREKKPRSLMMRGIDALSRREYSRLELYRKLMRTLTEGETADDVIAVLDDLQAKGYLSDERYAEGRVRVRSMRYGNRRVAQELRQQGVDADAITAAMEQTEPEIDRACAVWQRKFGEAPADYKEKARQIRFLAARGFSFDVISKILSEAGSSADEDDFS